MRPDWPSTGPRKLRTIFPHTSVLPKPPQLPYVAKSKKWVVFSVVPVFTLLDPIDLLDPKAFMLPSTTTPSRGQSQSKHQVSLPSLRMMLHMISGHQLACRTRVPESHGTMWSTLAGSLPGGAAIPTRRLGQLTQRAASTALQL